MVELRNLNGYLQAYKQYRRNSMHKKRISQHSSFQSSKNSSQNNNRSVRDGNIGSNGNNGSGDINGSNDTNGSNGNNNNNTQVRSRSLGETFGSTYPGKRGSTLRSNSLASLMSNQDPIKLQRKQYRSNYVRSYKYTPLTFVPLIFMYQFTRVPNLWFLISAVLQQIRFFGSGKSATLYLLCVAIGTNMIIELLNDWKRHQKCHENNVKQQRVLRHKDQKISELEWKSLESQKIFVGDIVMVRKDESIPADIVVLATSGQNNTSYIQTTNLDGEANLKVKYNYPETQQLFGRFGKTNHNNQDRDKSIRLNQSNTNGYQAMQDENQVISQIESILFTCEQPNRNINYFEGKMSLDVVTSKDTIKNREFSLDNDYVLLRDCQLKNTAWVIGLVLFAGRDCKIQQSQIRGSIKKNSLEKALNYIYLTVLVCAIILFLILAHYNQLFVKTNAQWFTSNQQAIGDERAPGVDIFQSYLQRIQGIKVVENENPMGNFQGMYFMYYLAYQYQRKFFGSVGFVLSFFQILFLMTQLIPIALIFIYDVIEALQANSLNLDPELQHRYYVKEGDKQIEQVTPFMFRTTRVGEDLGLCKYIFSDKTGTLTENVLEFVSCDIGRYQFGSLDGAQGEASQLKNGNTSKQNQKQDFLETGKHRISQDPKLWRYLYDNNRRNNTRDQDTRNDAQENPSNRQRSSQEATQDSSNLSRKELNGITKGGNEIQQNGNNNQGQDRDMVVEFWRIMAICNQLLIHQDGDDLKAQLLDYNRIEDLEPVVFQGQSSDDVTAAEAAQQLGIKLIYRDKDTAYVKNDISKQVEVIKIEATNKFTSSRKRMSVLCKFQDNSYRLYCKGADSAIMPRIRDISKNRSQSEVFQDTQEYISAASKKGYRTLAVACKQLSPQDAQDFLQKFNDAEQSMIDREDMLLKIADQIEQDLELVGASVVEDRLQDGVPDTILSMQQAGINVWMLTGDQLDTAMSIGKSCQLLVPSMNQTMIVMSKKGMQRLFAQNGIAVGSQDDLLVNKALYKSKNSKNITSNSALGILHNFIDDYLEQIDRKGNKRKQGGEQEEISNSMDELLGQANPWALVIEGDLIDPCLSRSLEDKFFRLCQNCSAVICCRASPKNKAQIVKTVKEKSRQICLAIGDGENDVVMIKQANIGIGICGKEGTQAAQVADYQMGRFRFLKHLLLVRGRWINVNNQIMAYFYIYKEIVQFLVMAWWILYTGFSAIFTYTLYMQLFTDVIITNIPITYLAYVNQDVQKEVLMDHPDLYKEINCQNSRLYYFKGLMWVAEGVLQSLILYYVNYEIMLGNSRDGYVVTYFELGVCIFTGAIITLTIKVMLLSYIWVKRSTIIIFGAFAVFVVIIYGQSLSRTKNPAYYGIIQHLVRDSRYWLGSVILAPMICVLIDFLQAAFLPFYGSDLKKKRMLMAHANRKKQASEKQSYKRSLQNLQA